MQASRDIARLIEIMAALRTPGTGCPWDLEQNFATHRALHAGRGLRGRRRDRARRSRRPARGAGRSAPAGRHFTPAWRRSKAPSISATWSQAITEKLLRRHPHVFGDARGLTPRRSSSSGIASRARRKPARTPTQAERPAARWPGVPVGLPALTRALKLQQKAGKVGFDWNDPMAVLAKIREEADEIEAAIRAGERKEAAAEVGDLLFAVVNLARHLDADPEARAARDQSEIRAPFRLDRARARRARQDARRVDARRDGCAVGRGEGGGEVGTACPAPADFQSSLPHA